MNISIAKFAKKKTIIPMVIIILVFIGWMIFIFAEKAG